MNLYEAAGHRGDITLALSHRETLAKLQAVSFMPSRSLNLRPRSYFESLSTSGPGPSNSIYAKASSRERDKTPPIPLLRLFESLRASGMPQPFIHAEAHLRPARQRRMFQLRRNEMGVSGSGQGNAFGEDGVAKDFNEVSGAASGAVLDLLAAGNAHDRHVPLLTLGLDGWEQLHAAYLHR